MKNSLNDAALDLLFREARSYNRWSAAPVPEQKLRDLYELLKMGPTSVNCSPARFLFVTSAGSRSRLIKCLAPSNVVKVETAPVTVIIGMDEKFYEKIPTLFPHNPAAADWFKDTPAGPITMMRNATLQGAYLMLAARAVGLDCGPMSGFDNAKVDAEFFAGSNVKSNFLCALGTGSQEMLFPRSPRLSFDEACTII